MVFGLDFFLICSLISFSLSPSSLLAHVYTFVLSDITDVAGLLLGFICGDHWVLT